MTYRSAMRLVFGLSTALVLGSPLPLAAQQSTTGPMFSTPASRSTTGAPILSDPTADGNGAIIDSIGGGAKTRPAATTEKAQKPASNTDAAAAQFKEWVLQCVEQGKEPARCQVSGSTLSGDGKQVILVMSLAFRPDGKTVAMQMAVPLGVALKDGVKFDVAGGYKTSMALSRCTPQGCLVEGAVEPALIDAMKAKAKATVTVATPEGKAIPIALSLSGFSDAYAALIERQAGAKKAAGN
ncbi:invasion associated locus B family protein [Ensifer sp.]|uniref:invasion associated locus B family protein n=1 Tax=Ensifer sp. TaxID=1872086 RepID=UPI0013AFDC7F|nr:invasion associated locus B family protein [Ensifer sp.]